MFGSHNKKRPNNLVIGKYHLHSNIFISRVGSVVWIDGFEASGVTVSFKLVFFFFAR